MPAWLIPALAFVCMASQDFLGALIVIAEARGRAKLAGTLGMLTDLTNIASVGIGTETVLNHGLTARTFWVLGLTMAGSFFGKMWGTMLGSRFQAA